MKMFLLKIKDKTEFNVIKSFKNKHKKWYLCKIYKNINDKKKHK